VDDYSNNAYIGTRFRKKRFRYFKQRLKNLKKPLKIIDIGGTVNFWVNENFHKRKGVDITVVNLVVEGSAYPTIKVVEGDACHLDQFANKEFDVAFSNSLIEHLFTFEKTAKNGQRGHARRNLLFYPNTEQVLSDRTAF